MLKFHNSFSFEWKWVKFQVSIWHYSANYYSDFNLLAIGFHRNWKSSRDSPWRLKGNLHGEVWTEGKSPQQICWRLDATGKSPVFYLLLCMAWWEIYKLHWCKQIPSVSAKGARSSIEKLFYFTRISEDKCNESLEATLTYTPSIILCVIAGYTFGWKQCLALRRWKYIAVEENFWGWSWKCDISSCSLCLFVFFKLWFE